MHARHWTLILPFLAAGTAHAHAHAHAQTQVEVRQPSEAFTTKFQNGEVRAALPLIEPDAKACIAEAGGDKATIDSLDKCVLLLAYYGVALAENGRSVEAVPIAKRATEVAATFGVESEMSLVANFMYGLVLERQGQHSTAEEPFRIALAGAEKLLAGDPSLAAYVARRVNNLVMLARYAEALPLAERAVVIGGDTADGNFFRLMQGNALMRLGRLAEAEKTFRIGIERLTVLMGPATPQTLGLREALALCVEEQNRPEEAVTIWRDTLRIRRAAGDTPDVGDSLTGLGVALMRMGQYREAEGVLREALTLRLRFYGESSNFTGLAYSNVGLALMELGNLDESALMFQRALAVLSAAGGANPEELAILMNNMATVLSRAGAYEEAVSLLRQVLVITEGQFGAGHMRTVMARNNLAASLGRLKQRKEAIALLQTNYDAAKVLGGQGAQFRALSAVSLAALLAEEGDRAQARTWYARAEAEGRTSFRPDHQQRINIGWGYGNFLLGDPAGLPLARTLLREAGRQVLSRAAAGTGFDAQAQTELGAFTIVFRDQVQAAWGLSKR
ncbi:tetratricopeptide repeat protein [Sphingomonas sp. MG17]|uniref:Tetratricopeptide repeat protein n=1 Tax=Sphingomonas tagetis TaxID=2949092 RepID=A0A9X2KKU7_9SPHN|nr:tetratricopeptide repeat protein [Sphingomonas tagetis]MCP3730869.1 tetratricopeptide repeat protein [Sphingomonas tagetis]